MQSTVNGGQDLTSRQKIGNLKVDPAFFRFVEEELLPAIGFDSGRYPSSCLSKSK